MKKQSNLHNEWEQTATLSIPSRLDHVWILRAALSGLFHDFGMVEQDIHLLGIAVVEVANNSIEHGYAGEREKPVEVRLLMNRFEVQLEIYDHARAFPESQICRIEGPAAPIDPSEEWSLRGHGLQIVRQIVDSIWIRFENGRNCVAFRKRISMQPGQSPSF